MVVVAMEQLTETEVLELITQVAAVAVDEHKQEVLTAVLVVLEL
jgi:hypothetical protein